LTPPVHLPSVATPHLPFAAGHTRPTRNGETFDPILVQGLEISPLNESVAPQFAGVEGHSHIPLFIADNQFFGPANTPPEGRYRYEIAMRDQAGNGWDITAQFVVRKKG
jgi:hypothetical protein